VRRPGTETTHHSLGGEPPTLIGMPVPATRTGSEDATSPLPSHGGLTTVAPSRPRTENPAFTAGDMIAQRYRVARFIARGGMGEVYEADDLELRERVALKTVRPEVAGDTLAVERFKREIQLARKVTHPNVCRIFDASHHRPDGDASSGVIFLTMELLVGETLAERLRRKGPLQPAEALPIARQVADALHAAHQAGIVHRDLKPGNVMLVEGRGSLRAVVTDSASPVWRAGVKINRARAHRGRRRRHTGLSRPGAGRGRRSLRRSTSTPSASFCMRC